MNTLASEIASLDRVMPTREERIEATLKSSQQVQKLNGKRQAAKPVKFGKAPTPCTIDGQRYASFSAAARAHGVKTLTVKDRCANPKWPGWKAPGVEKVVKRVPNRKCVVVDGHEFASVTECAQAFDVDLKTVKNRIESRLAKWECWGWG